VHLIQLDREPDPQPARPSGRAVPAQPQPPEAALPVPQALTAATVTPDFPDLPAARPGLAPLDLAGGPYLAPPGESLAARTPPAPPQRSPAQPRSGPVATVLQAEIRPVVPAAPGGSEPAGAPDGIGQGDDEAIPVLRIEPAYPRKAARSGEEGWVKIEFTITEHGTVVDPVVVEARPRRVFDRSALAAIRQWQFRPRLDNGEPVARRASQVIEFRLANR
jgi:protein TonB